MARTSYILRRAYSHYADIPFQNKDAPFRLDRAFGRRVAATVTLATTVCSEGCHLEVSRLERITAKRLIDGDHSKLDAVEPCKLIWLSEVLAMERDGR